MRTFAECLRAAIREAGISQVEFAERVGISKQLVTDMIADRRTPNLDQASKWADVLGLRGPDREHFLDLAILRHLPSADVQERIRVLADLADQLRRERAGREDG